MRLSLRGVGVHFGESHALRDIDLEIAPGEAVGIIGPPPCAPFADWGQGRAGTAAALVLIHHGMAPAGAILLVRWARPGAIQAQEQEDLLLGWTAG